MDPGSGDPGEKVYSGLPGNTVGMATMVDMSEASKQKSDCLDKLMQEECVHFRVGATWRGKRGPFLSF